MAAITTATLTGGSRYVRQATAQVTTGQTDWVAVPGWAKTAIVDLNLTAVAGTSPLVDLTVKSVDPVSLNDTYAVDLHAAFTQITAAAHLRVNIGPGITGIADDVTTAATGVSEASLNRPLPSFLGLKVLNDRTTGDETYTYNLSVTFRG
jgi:hypothetical protein